MKTEPMVRKQYPPYFIVKSAGVCIEYTDDRKAAHQAYASGNDLDKGIWKVEGNGLASCVRRMVAGRELGGPVIST